MMSISAEIVMPVAQHQLQFLPLRKSYPDAPLFIFLPGMDGTGQLLRSQIGRLEDRFEVRCLMIPANDLTDWNGLAHQVIELIRAEVGKNPQRPVYLCGESFGGCLALKVVLQAPRLIHRLILVNPASSFNHRPWLSWGSHLVRLLPESLYPMSCSGLLPFLANLERIDAGNQHALLDAMKSVSHESSIWRLSLLRDFYIADVDLASILQPALLVVGQADRLLPSMAEVERLKTLMPNARKYVLPRSGHACLLETGVNLYKILQDADFLSDRYRRLAKSDGPSVNHL
ncbi:MAG TPA: alpha/beta fold hydrolase [Elainellaceae cyanobacterium]